MKTPHTWPMVQQFYLENQVPAWERMSAIIAMCINSQSILQLHPLLSHGSLTLFRDRHSYIEISSGTDGKISIIDRNHKYLSGDTVLSDDDVYSIILNFALY